MHAEEHEGLLIKDVPLGPVRPGAQEDDLKRVRGKSTNGSEGALTVLDSGSPGLRAVEIESEEDTERDYNESELDLGSGEPLGRNTNILEHLDSGRRKGLVEGNGPEVGTK